VSGKRNIDSVILFILSIILIVGMIFISDIETYIAFVILIILIYLYEFLIWDNVEIWGFTGMTILSPISVIFVVYTVLLAFPGLYYFATYRGVGRYPFLISIYMFYLIFPSGLIASQKYFKIDVIRTSNYLKKQYLKLDIDQIIYEILLSLLVLVAGVVGFYLYIVPKIPLFEIFTNPEAYATLWVLREESMKLLEINPIIKYLFSWTRDLFFPLGIIGSLYLSSVYKSRKYNILFTAFILMGVFYNSLTVAKAPTAALILSVFAFIFLRKNLLSIKFVIVSILLILLFPIIIFYFVTPPHLRNSERILNSVFERIFLVPSQALIEYFKIFPNHHDFLLGRSTKIFSWIHPDGIFDVSNYVAKVWWRRPFTTGSANAIFIGAAWADFGFFGVILWTFFIGYFTHFFYYKVCKISDYKKNILYVIFIVSTIMCFSFTFLSSSFPTILITRGLFIVVLIIFFISKMLKLNVN